MAKETEGLGVEVGITLNKLTKQLAQAEARMVKTAKKMEKDFNKSNTAAARSFEKIDRASAVTARNLSGLRNALIGALSVREVQQYADAWTTANNKLAASSQVAGMQARSLSEVNDIATLTRSGLTETADLYAKLLRATKGVAKSELEVAKATEIVNKSFKAGGAAASEQAAGILQLGQGLSSGILQGDELKSLRENAPLLAQAIADEFQTTIGGLKQLGADGELTAARVFKGILAAQSGIDAAFAETNSTIGESFVGLRNALTEYVGVADESIGATEKIASALKLLAENIDLVVLAGGVLGAKFIGPVLLTMLKKTAGVIGLATAGLSGLSAGATVSAAGVGALRVAMGLLGGPVGLAITAALLLGQAWMSFKPAIQGAGDYIDLAAKSQKALSEAMDHHSKEVSGDSHAAARESARLAKDQAEASLAAALAEVTLMEAEAARFANAPKEERGLLGDLVDDNLTEELEAANAVVAEMRDNIVKSQDAIDALGSGAAGINFDGAAASASNLADELQRAVNAAINLASQGVADVEKARINYEFRSDPIAKAGALARAEFDAQTPTGPETDSTVLGVIEGQRREYIAARVEAEKYRQATIEANKATSGSSGSGSGASSKPAAQTGIFDASDAQVERLNFQIRMIGQTSSKIAELTARQELLSEAKKRGLDVDKMQTASGQTLREEIDAQAASIGALTEKSEQYKEQAAFMDGMNQELKSGFLDAIVSGENFGSVLENVAKQLAKAALQAAIFGDGPMANLFGGGAKSSGGGILSGILGGLFGGSSAPKTSIMPKARPIPAFATGTDYAPGGIALVGEKGPELVNLPRGSQVIPNHEMNAGGMTISQSITINVQGGGNMDAEKMAAMVGPAVQRNTQQALARARREGK